MKNHKITGQAIGFLIGSLIIVILYTLLGIEDGNAAPRGAHPTKPRTAVQLVESPVVKFPARKPRIIGTGFVKYWGAPVGEWQVSLSDGAIWSVPWCRGEDDTNCYWNAVKRGNKVGQSFLNLHGVTYYSTGDRRVVR